MRRMRWACAAALVIGPAVCAQVGGADPAEAAQRRLEARQREAFAPGRQDAAEVLAVVPLGPARARRRPVTAEDVAEYAQILGLTEAQRGVALALHEGYRAALVDLEAEHARRARAAAEAAREASDPDAAAAAMEELARRREAERAAVEEGLFQDLRAILEGEQAERWERVQRRRRREALLPLGFLSGERVDLREVAQEVCAAAGEGVTSEMERVLEEWEGAVDRALAQRERSAAALYGAGEVRLEAGSWGGEAGAFWSASRAVAEVTGRYGRELVSVSPAVVAGALSEAIDRATYPEVYAERAADVGLARALGLADLSGEERAAVAALAEAHRGGVREIAAGWAEGVRRAEAGQPAGWVRGGVLVVGVGGGWEEVVAWRSRRAARDAQTLERLGAIVGAERLSRLASVPDGP